ncbi:hypothetical protein PT277_01745 [Acetobacteraceae bacterium ESL0709]|nr:hypothetical protein [Acetobacteraceae bacterium ESL0697]MDF7677425.1 hypothetical protein [Acetobacteraceae bacterium ESL0709]
MGATAAHYSHDTQSSGISASWVQAFAATYTLIAAFYAAIKATQTSRAAQQTAEQAARDASDLAENLL